MFQINLVKNVLTKICFGQFLILIRIKHSNPDSNTGLGSEKYDNKDPGCLSRIPDPNFYPSRILIFTHPGS